MCRFSGWNLNDLELVLLCLGGDYMTGELKQNKLGMWQRVKGIPKILQFKILFIIREENGNQDQR